MLRARLCQRSTGLGEEVERRQEFQATKALVVVSVVGSMRVSSKRGSLAVP